MRFQRQNDIIWEFEEIRLNVFKIDKLNLQQQLLKRYESVQKQSTNSSASTSKPTTTNKTVSENNLLL